MADLYYKRAYDAEWWQHVTAHVHPDEPQVNMWHGTVRALAPRAVEPDPLLALFNEQPKQLEFDIKPLVVKADRLNQVLWQLQHMHMEEPDSQNEAPPVPQWGFSQGRYTIKFPGRSHFVFYLPDPAAVQATEWAGEEE